MTDLKSPKLTTKQNPQNSSKFQSNTNSMGYIGPIHEAPIYMRDEKLLFGYRINFHSYKQVFKSLFMVHNQTVNIWTHFGGALILIIIIASGIYLQSDKFSRYSQNTSNSLQIKQPYPICSKQAELILQSKTIVSGSFQKLFGKQICRKQKSSKQQSLANFFCDMAKFQIKEIKNYLLQNYGENIKTLQKAVLNFQRHIIPQLINQIDQKSKNISFVQFMKENFQKLQDQLDQKSYDYVQMGFQVANPDHVSRWPLFAYLFSAFVCLACSAAFHLLHPLSSKAYKFFIGLDYAGINILIAGSAFPAFYYGMYCYFKVAQFYMAIIMMIGTTLFALSLTQWFKKPQYFVFKSVCYGGFSFFLTIPITHLIINQILFNNYGDSFTFIPSVIWYLLGAIAYTMGLFVFTTRCPDRKHPGKYDICGHSHQIWHSFVLLGIFLIYGGALVNYQVRKSSSCPVQF